MSLEAARLFEKNDFMGFFSIARDWCLIAVLAIFGISFGNPFFYVFVVWAIGAFQFALGEALVHDACHNNLFKTKSLNTLLEPIFAFPFFVSVDQYRSHHLEHHSDLGTDEDNIKITYSVHGLDKGSFFRHWFSKPLLGMAGLSYVRSAIALNTYKKDYRIPAFWVCVIGGFAFFNAINLLVFYWLVPLFWSFSSFLYWSEISDHYRVAEHSRTRTGLLSNLIFHNNGYHAVHHENPGIPWYNLKEAHFLLKPKTDISKGFFDTYRKIIRTSR